MNNSSSPRIKDWFKNLPIYGKFGQDIFWNIGSLVLLSFCGIILNVLIAKFYGATWLGVFNQIYVVYMILSQIAVFGIHFSVVKYIAEFKHDRRTCDQIISSAILAVIPVAAIICLILFISKNFIGSILYSQNVTIGLIYIVPGLFFFALNKVLIAVLNGYRFMRSYATVQAIRYILMVITLIFFILIKKSGIFLSSIFSCAEIILFVILIVYISRFYSFILPKTNKWFKEHFMFGFRSFFGGILIEANSRLDILILGLFATDWTVGIYSFAAMAIEGIVQLATVVRNNLNPVITNLFVNNRIESLGVIIRRGIKIFYQIIFTIGLVSILLYPLVIEIILPNTGFLAAWPVFSILMAGLILGSGYMPFNMLLLQIGFPAEYTKMMLLAVVFNIILNMALIPIVGMYGAAIATGLTYLFSALLLKFFTRRAIKLRI